MPMGFSERHGLKDTDTPINEIVSSSPGRCGAQVSEGSPFGLEEVKSALSCPSRGRLKARLAPGRALLGQTQGVWVPSCPALWSVVQVSKGQLTPLHVRVRSPEEGAGCSAVCPCRLCCSMECLPLPSPIPIPAACHARQGTPPCISQLLLMSKDIIFDPN